MNSFLMLFVFILVTLIYLHLKRFYYQSTDPNIYEIEPMHYQKEKIEKVLSLRNPCLMYPPMGESLMEWIAAHPRSQLQKRCPAAAEQDWLEESGLLVELRQLDALLVPSQTLSKSYSIKLASDSRWEYFLQERTYWMVSGTQSVKIRLLMPKKSTHLQFQPDWEHFLFTSPPTLESEPHVLSLELAPGRILSIPPFWWVQAIFPPDIGETVLYSFQYRTIINTLAILPQFFQSFLQRQNIQWKYNHTVPQSPGT